jgi:hypothetical protein
MIAAAAAAAAAAAMMLMTTTTPTCHRRGRYSFFSRDGLLGWLVF